MGSICIKIKDIESEINKLQDCEKNMDVVIDNIDKIKANISLDSATENIKKQLNNVKLEIEKQKNCIKILVKQLGKIAKLYKKAESNIFNTDLCNEFDFSQIDYIFTDEEKSDLDQIEDELKKLAKEFGITLLELALLYMEINELVVNIKTGEAKFEELLKNYIPENVSDEAVMAFYSLISGETSKDIVLQLFTRVINKLAWEDYLSTHGEGKYIEDQSALSEMLYGYFHGDKNTCGVIAAYNALLSLNAEVDADTFPRMLAYFENTGIVAQGVFGTSPDAINDFFKKEGYNTNMLAGDGISPPNLSAMSDNYETYIMLRQYVMTSHL